MRLLRPVQYTVAPASPNIRAIPRPAPRVAPATTATRPLNGLGMASLVVWLTLQMSRAPYRSGARRLHLQVSELLGCRDVSNFHDGVSAFEASFQSTFVKPPESIVCR